ncbi:MAG: winged helix-turn-helix domain-containing protein [Sulfurimonas sp.]
MIMDKNSLLAHYNGRYTGRFSKKRFEVYVYIAENPNMTRQDLADTKELNQPINSICGRVKELVDEGLVVEIKEEPRNRLVAVLPEDSIGEDKPTTIKGVQIPTGVNK